MTVPFSRCHGKNIRTGCAYSDVPQVFSSSFHWLCNSASWGGGVPFHSNWSIQHCLGNQNCPFHTIKEKIHFWSLINWKKDSKKITKKWLQLKRFAVVIWLPKYLCAKCVKILVIIGKKNLTIFHALLLCKLYIGNVSCHD